MDRLCARVGSRCIALAVLACLNRVGVDAVAPSARCSDELPDPSFPSASAAESRAAWPSGAQPQALECWPREGADGSPGACADHVSVLEDTEDGWPGTCTKLQRVPSGSAAECEADCRQQATCQGFQWTDHGECWRGQGSGCYWRNGFVPAVARRFMHGSVRVLMDLRGWQVFGLTNVFTARANGYFTDGAAAAACKLACYSDIQCSYWTYNVNHGCWIEDPGSGASVAYPLTLGAITNTTEFARDNIAGEYIQHFCPGHDGFFFPIIEAAQRVATSTGDPEARWHAALGIFAGCLFLCCCFSLIARTPSARRRRRERSDSEGTELQPVSYAKSANELAGGFESDTESPLLDSAGVDVGARDVQHRHTLAPLSSAALVLSHPHLVSLGTLGNPVKLVRLLHNCEVGPLDAFCAACPAECLSSALPKLLSDLSGESIELTLAPLLNNERLHPCLVAMLTSVDTDVLVELLNGSSADCLGVVLQVRPASLTSLVAAVRHDRVPSMLVPVNEVPVAVFDMVVTLGEPARAGAVVNFVDAEVLVWLLEEVPGDVIAGIMNAVDTKDFVETGCFIRFLQALEGERFLSVERVAPFVQIVPGKVVGQLIQGVSAHKLLEVLRRIGAENVATILANTNVDFIIRLWNGPLESAVSFFAGGLSEVEKHRLPAFTIKKVTDKVNSRFLAYDRKVQRGKELRLARRESLHRRGDFRRGLMGDVVENIRALRCCAPARQTSEFNLEVAAGEDEEAPAPGKGGLPRSFSF